MFPDLKQRLQAPSVYEALTALIAQQPGFDAVYLSGASIANSKLGRSDMGLALKTFLKGSSPEDIEEVRALLRVGANGALDNLLVGRAHVVYERGERPGSALL